MEIKESKLSQIQREFNKIKQPLIEYIHKSGNFSEKQAEMIFDKAWEEGHAYGIKEVQICIDDIIEWLSDFMQN
ncbi:MAG: hypothetical protein [Wendovervirus sonii]|uniref:Uncharacterized protein n=1 Tax=phage Lak_Megaphage_Sonny TaxID=3109229 RepID=A0ABZ0Z2C2_9CAUD|nr:MAG: hypothetical protein [phage Lak_Megaphage_Sonny]